jgi:hypothetical protein
VKVRSVPGIDVVYFRICKVLFKEFREGFNKLDILTVPCLYIYALMIFVVKNLDIYQTNTSVHGRNARQQNELHIALVRLPSIQTGVYYSSITISNKFREI